MSIDYTTMEVSAERRFEYWTQVVCRHCISANSNPLDKSDFEGRLQVRNLGDVDLCTISAPMHHWERTTKHVSTNPDDDLWLGFMDQSSGTIEQGGRRSVLENRSLVLYDADQAFRFNFGGPAAHLLRIPRHLLSKRVPGIEKLTAIVLDERRPGLTPLREMLSQAVTYSAVTEDARSASRFGETVLELLVLSLEMQEVSDLATSRDLYVRAMRHIRQHLADPQMSIDSLASAMHVSPRTLSRAFGQHQKTPMATIWQERLASSRRAIEQGRVANISQAALEHGFSDFSHFSHAFRKAFGVSPSELLNRH